MSTDWPGWTAPIEQRLPGAGRSRRQAGKACERPIGRHRNDQSGRHGRQFGKGAAACRIGARDHPVTRPDGGDERACCNHRSGEIGPERIGEGEGEEVLQISGKQLVIHWIEGGGLDTDEHVVKAGYRLGHVLDPDIVYRAIGMDAGGLHHALFG
ncbi:hypothetical protein GGE56_000475 [Rhizobium leguminosarum]|nr:hypothetical protein [Rhizobium leguminosarum]